MCLIQPYFNYCSPLWNTCAKTLNGKMQNFPNRAARGITGAIYDLSSTEIRFFRLVGPLYASDVYESHF